MIQRIEDPARQSCVDCFCWIDPTEDEWAARYFGRCADCVARCPMEELLDMTHFLEEEES